MNQGRAFILFVLLHSFFNNSIAVASNSNTQPDPSQNSASPKLLYGKVNELETQSELSKSASFGFTCVPIGSPTLPAKVTDIRLNSLAYQQGLKVNDQIIQIRTTNNVMELNIERDGKPYSIALSSSTSKSDLKSEIAKSALSDKKTQSKQLYGNVNQLELRPALSQYASFGFLAAREGANDLPARVSNVTLKSMAYWQGLKTNDRILEVHAQKNTIKLSIERDGKPYSIILSTQHPFIASEISRTSLSGTEQKNYGDCWFDAAIVAVGLSPQGQHLISAMITQISPSSYYVTFPDQPTIAWPINLKTIQHYQLQNKALWASLLEEACLLRFPDSHQKGGHIWDALTMLTGKQAGAGIVENAIAPHNPLPGVQPTPLSMTQMAEIINKALLNHESVEISTKASFELNAEQRLAVLRQAGVALSPDGKLVNPNIDRDSAVRLQYLMRSAPKIPLILWPKHAYTVTGFDPSTNAITLRNPFGTEALPESGGATIDLEARNKFVQDLGNGEIRMNFDVLYRYMRALSWTKM